MLITGIAWLLSVRALRCQVNSLNGRNPFFLFLTLYTWTLERLPVICRRKVGMTSSHHGLYGLGYTRVTMIVTKGNDNESLSES